MFCLARIVINDIVFSELFITDNWKLCNLNLINFRDIFNG